MLEGIWLYDDHDFLEKIIKIEKNTPICLVVDGIIDYNSFQFEISQIFDLKQENIIYSNNITFIQLNSYFKNLNTIFNSKFKILHYEIYSIFLKKSLNSSILSEFPSINTNYFYVYLEDITNIFTNKINTKNVIDIKENNFNLKKYLYGFSNFADLIAFYIDLAKTKTNWPFFAIIPEKVKQSKEETNRSIILNIKKLLNFSKSYPVFNPFKFLFYFSFIEKNPPNSKRILNTNEFYGIKNISDIQISYFYQQKSGLTIRTFLGFNHLFRCFQAFIYFSSLKNNSICDLILMTNDQISLNKIKYDSFYIETQNQLDSSILYSINNNDSFNFKYDNIFSTFFSFDNYEDFYEAKKIIKNSIFSDDIDYIFTDIKLIEKNEFSLLFPHQKMGCCFLFLIFQLKHINKSKENSINLSSLLKHSIEIKRDMICSLDKKNYIVASFNDKKKAEETFLALKYSKYSITFNTFYPENSNKSKNIDKEINSVEQNKKLKKERKKPIFEPKENFYYIYFQEYKKSKSSNPSNDLKPLFGIQNISDIQRNYYFPNEEKEYTFLGFTSKKNLKKAISNFNLKKNALNGTIIEFKNFFQYQNVSKTDNCEVNDTEKELTPEINLSTKNSYENDVKNNSISQDNEIQFNNNNNIPNSINSNQIELNNNPNKSSTNINTINNISNKSNESNNNSNEINKNSNEINNYPNESNNYPNKLNSNSNNNSNEFNNYPNEPNNYPNKLNSNSNNYSNELSNNTENINREFIEDFNYDYDINISDISDNMNNNNIEDFNFIENNDSPSDENDEQLNIEDEQTDLVDYIEQMKNIQLKILNFIDDENNNENDFTQLKHFLLKQNISKIKEIINIIAAISNYHHRSHSFSKKIENLLLVFKKQINQHFTMKEIFNLFHANKKTLLFLIENKMFSFNQDIVDYIIEDNYILSLYYFYPEVKNYLDMKRKKEIEEDIADIKNFEELRKIGENEFIICKIIREDSISDFISYTSKINKDINKIPVDISIFETNSMLSFETYYYLIDYAAFFGSWKIFQYLYNLDNECINKCDLIYLFAVHGKNKEIINLIVQNKIKDKNYYINKFLNESIKCHHIEITEYIKSNLLTKESNDEYERRDHLDSIFQSYNYFELPKDLDTQEHFYYLCKYNYITLVKILLETRKDKLNLAVIFYIKLMKFINFVFKSNFKANYFY